MTTVIVKYNAGNTKSVVFALNRLGIEPIISNDIEVLQSADKVIFPGVGHAKSAMESLRENGLEEVLPQLKQPFLGICLGQQLMCKHSEEGNVACLGMFDLEVKRFPATDKIPHMGWNQVNKLKGPLFEGISEEEYFYHVHSYYVPDNPHSIATCDYITPFATAIQKDNFYAAQFHPEKSGEAGGKLLKNFLSLKQ